MNKLLSGVCATTLAFAVTATGMAPAFAAPRAMPESPATDGNGVIKVQSSSDDVIKLRRDRREAQRERREDRREASRERQRDWREARQERREDWREARQDRREARRDDRQGYYRGYRGYRDYRPGYKRHGDYWYPAAAFLAGGLITGAIANSQPREVIVQRGGSHEEWCANRYRSYRAYDNSFQPYNGPRQQCVSPYG
ncbi:BA14K family protein [Mesorhizobium sp. CN2-181]|uniref:BA14K family protein n=1 Tax=Mesorhizobium yinganensis TaxID=3157707 RepID=UPI0032B839C8